MDRPENPPVGAAERAADLLERIGTEPEYRIWRFEESPPPGLSYWCDGEQAWRTPYGRRKAKPPAGAAAAPEGSFVGRAATPTEALLLLAGDMAARSGTAEMVPPTEIVDARVAGTDCMHSLAGAAYMTIPDEPPPIDAPTDTVAVSETVPGEPRTPIGNRSYGTIGALIAESALFAVESHIAHLVEAGTPRSQAEALAAGSRSEWEATHDEFTSDMAALRSQWGPLHDAGFAEYTPCVWRYSAAGAATYQIAASLLAHARATQAVTLTIPPDRPGARELWATISPGATRTGRTDPRLAWNKAQAPLAVWAAALRSAASSTLDASGELLLDILEAELGEPGQPTPAADLSRTPAL